MRSIQHLLHQAQGKLPAAARSEAGILLAHTLGKARSFLHAYPEFEPAPEAKARFVELVARRVRGEPIAYLTGRREFWSLDLRVTPATLIPRPETELLVEHALQALPPNRPCAVADLGTGSGAIALAIASERPLAAVTATDVSPHALIVARDNAARLSLDHVTFVEGDWFAPLSGRRYHLIVSNPPYVAEDDPHLAMGDLPAEPRAALASGADGLAAIRRIAAEAPAHLMAGATLLMEHGAEQRAAARLILNSAGFCDIRCFVDLAGRDRVTRARIQAPDGRQD